MSPPLPIARTLALFVATAVAEIVGCYLPYVWLRRQGSVWLVAPAAMSLATFAWLLTLHPTSAGRTYAMYGGVYVAVGVAWALFVEKQPPDRWDLLGAAISVVGMGIMAFAPR